MPLVFLSTALGIEMASGNLIFKFDPKTAAGKSVFKFDPKPASGNSIFKFDPKTEEQPGSSGQKGSLN